MLSLVLAESSLELVPKELRRHPSVKSHARRLRKRPSEILLDNSWHYSAMKGIKNEMKRGRPDLVHLSILEATSIPLYQNAMLDLYVHTANDRVVLFGEGVRIPKSYHRFQGLIEKLLTEGTIMSEGKTLLEVKSMTFRQLIDLIRPSRVIGLGADGVYSSYEGIAEVASDDACIVVGGFQKGDFSPGVGDCISDLYSVGDSVFEAHVVVSRILYECEKTIM